MLKYSIIGSNSSLLPLRRLRRDDGDLEEMMDLEEMDLEETMEISSSIHRKMSVSSLKFSMKAK